MMIEADESLDMSHALNRLKGLSRQAEWEDLMDKFQKRLEGSQKDVKWQRMNKIFDLSDCK